MKSKIMDIDLDKLFNPAFAGVARCYSFVSIIQNRIISSEVVQDDLHPKFGLRFDFNFNPKQTSEDLLHWVNNNGLRELIESFEFFLVELYCALVLLDKKILLSLDERRKFQFKNFADKTSELKRYIAFVDDNEKFIKTLQDIRGSITYHRSLVLKDKFRDKIVLEIPKFVFLFRSSSGEEMEIKEFPAKGPEGWGIAFKMTYEEKKIEEYQIINFDFQQMVGICYKINLILNNLKDQLVAYCNGKNIEIKIKS